MSRNAAVTALELQLALHDGSKALRNAKAGWDAERVVLRLSEVSDAEPDAVFSSTETVPSDFASTHDDCTPQEDRQSDTTADTMLVAEKIASDWRSPFAPIIRSSFDLLQQWECTVVSISESEFVAIARDRIDPERPDEEVVFDRSDVNDTDRLLLNVGAVFYWNVGYRVSEWGQKTKGSELRFRRLPAWSKRALAAAEKRADELGLLFVEDENG